MAAAIDELELLISRALNIVETSSADRRAAFGPDGYRLKRLWRPEYRAYIDLMGCYDAVGQTAKAIATGRTLAQLISGDGWYWLSANRRVGDLCARHGAWGEAAEQYALALAGCAAEMADVAVRGALLGSKYTLDNWLTQLAELATLAKTAESRSGRR